jgi:DNA-binding NarL/FixJ family response regulator
MIDYAAILSRRFPTAQWTLNGDDYDGLTWLDDSPMPSKKQLDGLWDEVQAEVAAEAQAKVDARQSAVTKLAALGLTDTEISALIGA